jgi:hypothetical protein
MHAVVVTVDIHDGAAAKSGLDEQVVPMLKGTPGFVAGYWIRLDDTHGTSFVVYDSEERARASAPQEGTNMPGVTMTSVSIGEVLAYT